MSRRTLAYIGIALALLVGGRLLTNRAMAPSPPAESPPAPSPAPEASAPEPPAAPLRRRAHASAELGVLTDREEAELRAAIVPATLAASLAPRHCGDERACEAVRAVLQDEHATSLDVVAASDWSLAQANLDASAASFSPAERARIAKKARVVAVRVAVATSARALAVRAAFAAAAALAEKVDGLVWDQLLDRIETAKAFAQHAVTEPLDASAFRPDRVQVLYEPKEEGVVRVLTAGLARWGAPDVEVQSVPSAASARMGRVVLAVAQSLADGAVGGPLPVSLGDAGPVSVDLVSAHPENGDPNDFMARIEPPGGEGVVASLELVERFFGPNVAVAPEEDAMAAVRGQAQAKLGAALAKWTAARGAHAAHPDGGAPGSAATLLVRLPFAIPGDAGVEAMWIEVTRYDAQTVTGKLVDEPLGATDVTRGDEVTRPRADVESVELRSSGGN